QPVGFLPFARKPITIGCQPEGKVSLLRVVNAEKNGQGRICGTKGCREDVKVVRSIYPLELAGEIFDLLESPNFAIDLENGLSYPLSFVDCERPFPEGLLGVGSREARVDGQRIGDLVGEIVWK